MKSSDPPDSGEQRCSGEDGWYQRKAEAIAHLLVYLRVVEVDGGGRRRAPSGGRLRLLSDEGSDKAPAMWMVSGGSPRDDEPGDAYHYHRARTTSPELEKTRRRRKTLKLGLWRRWSDWGAKDGGSGISEPMRTRGGYL